MKTHHILTSAVLLFMTSNLAYAEQNQLDGQWYFQGSIGYSVVDMDNMLDEKSYDVNNDDISYELAVGYLFTDYVGVKIGWRELGKGSYKSSSTSTRYFHSEQEFSSLFIAMTGHYPIAEHFELVGSAGFSRLTQSRTANIYDNGSLTSTETPDDYDFTEPYFSLGVEYSFNRNITIISEFIHQPMTEIASANTYQLGIKYKF
ncbi:outer membrane beta-barrel protein [Vibrio rhodolitus]|uniref:outer membrane beta-barrel protein n=1 Tax=Vibrio rhodolitus TaxID=2231649 RepID=UPI000E0C6F40|nr:outer membrane beta-barrel protein [Vibrio rhodolitus]